jgi:putative toxin-antitoxin system antitoxin component (TIGR02293 family)
MPPKAPPKARTEIETAVRTTEASEGRLTISEVSERLKVPQHVLRFWETKFAAVRPLRRGGGRRYYRPEDVEVLKIVRDLLYEKGHTIKSAQKLLRERGLDVDPNKREAHETSPKETLEALISSEVPVRIALVEQIRRGFRFDFVEQLAKQAGLNLNELVDLGVIPRRTLAYSRQNEQFSATQSDRATRFFRVFQKARDTFGSEDKAMQWLRRPTRPLQNNAPVGLLDTEEGARLVEDLLTRIDHGIAA